VEVRPGVGAVQEAVMDLVDLMDREEDRLTDLEDLVDRDVNPAMLRLLM
jgi:hypothetical protein